MFSATRDSTGFLDIVHGGVISIVVDQTLGGLRTDVPYLTAYLKVDFKAPMRPETVYYCLATIDRLEGPRKMFVTCQITDNTGKLYSTAESLLLKSTTGIKRPAGH
jgi:acyl-coenzyme A thioesterase PaaI-like protein